MQALLAILGLVAIIVGIVRVIQGAVLWGILLVVVGVALGGGSFLT